jgi:Fe-S-cluster-containing dehydrogenase component
MMSWLRDLLRVDVVATAPAPAAAPPETLARQLALVIDLNVCVGCHACVTSCKQWNTSGAAGPLVDDRPCLLYTSDAADDM